MAAPKATKVRGSAFKVSFPHDSRLCCLAHCILTPTFPSQRYRFVVKPGAFNSEPRTLNPEPFLLFLFFFFTLFSIIANTYLNFWMLYTIDIVEQ